MLISNVHKSIIVMNSLDTRFSKNVFEAVQKTRSTCFIGSKTTRLRLVVLNPMKHSCSFFKHYMEYLEESLAGQGSLVLTRREVAQLVQSINRVTSIQSVKKQLSICIGFLEKKNLIKHAIFSADLKY